MVSTCNELPKLMKTVYITAIITIHISDRTFQNGAVELNGFTIVNMKVLKPKYPIQVISLSMPAFVCLLYV